MYAILGDIEFKNLIGPETFNHKEASSYAEHATALNKPRLQMMGEKLDEISLAINLHNSFCTPEDVIARLRAYRKDGTILPLIMGTGEVVGDFVLTEFDREILQTSPTGEIVSAKINVSLKEHYDPNKLASKETAAKAAAFAFKELKPLPAQFIPQPTNPLTLVMGEISTAGTQTAKSDSILTALQRGLTTLSRAEKDLKKASSKVAQAAANAQGYISQYEALEQAATSLPDKIQQLNEHALTIGSLIPITNLADLTAANQLMQQSMTEVNSAAAPLAVLTALRIVI